MIRPTWTWPAGTTCRRSRCWTARGWACLSHQVWAGQPVPVATCLDCGHTSVSVEAAASCGTCMGSLVADDDVLDARFVGAVWPLAVAGWPADESGPAAAAPSTLLVAAP